MNLEELYKEFKRYSDLRESGKVKQAIEGYKRLLKEAGQHLLSEVPEMIGVSYRMLGKSKEGLSYAK